MGGEGLLRLSYYFYIGKGVCTVYEVLCLVFMYCYYCCFLCIMFRIVFIVVVIVNEREEEEEEEEEMRVLS